MKPKTKALRTTRSLLTVLLWLPMVACAGYSDAGLASSWPLEPSILGASDARGTQEQGHDQEAGHDHEQEGEQQHASADEQEGSAGSGKAVSHGSDFVPEGYPEPLGTNLTREWLAAWPHSHFSRLGTPFVHPFGLEPAYLDRDLILDYRHARSTDGKASEVEAELEWALTRRLGVVVEGRVARVDPDGASAESGLGDLVIAPRALLVDTDRLLLSFNLEGSFPTGDEDRGLGEGQVGLAPSLSAWFDFGHWIQGDLQVGTEHGLETGDTVLFYSGVLAWSFLGPALMGSSDGHGHGHGHEFMDLPAGLTNLILEFTGRTAIRGSDQGRATQELLFGISHSLAAAWELRVAYQIPIGNPEEFDDAFVLGLIYHF